MKKICFRLATAFTFAVMLSLIGCRKPEPIDPTPVPEVKTEEPAAPTAAPERTTSGETAALAAAAAEKLGNAVVFSLSYGISTERMYEAGRIEAPELDELEAKDDASAALAELYEDVLNELRAFDLDAYYAWCAETASDPAPELTEDFLHGRALLGEREAIEALLALDRYYDKLTDAQLDRLKTDLDAVAELVFAAEAKAFPDAVRGVPPFYRCREVRNSDGTFAN